MESCAFTEAAQAATDHAPLPTLDPNSPMAEDGQIHLPWPDEQFIVPELASLEPDPDIAAALKAGEGAPLPERVEGDIQQVSRRLALVFPADPAVMPMRSAFAERFAALSTIKRLSGEGDDSPAPEKKAPAKKAPAKKAPAKKAAPKKASAKAADAAELSDDEIPF